MTTVYFRTISGTNFRDVRFLLPHEDGMIAGLPDWNDHDEDHHNNNNEEEVDEGREDGGRRPGLSSSQGPTKRAKKMMPWNDDKGIFLWFDWTLLRDHDEQYWTDMLQHIVKLAPNLEVCVCHATPVPEEQQQHQQQAFPPLFSSSSSSAVVMPIGLPIKAMTLLLRGMPKIKKLDLRNLNFVGTNDDFAAFQQVIENYCPDLEELYYYGPPSSATTTSGSSDDHSSELLIKSEEEQKAMLANCLLSVKAPSNFKRLSMDGIELSKFNATTIRNIGMAKGMESLEFLKLQVQCDWEVIMALASTIKSLTKLTHFSLQLGKRESATPLSSVEEVAIQTSIQMLTEALSTHRLFVLELQVHSSLLSSPAFYSGSNHRFLQPWVDLLKDGYSYHKFSLTSILDDDTIYDPNDTAAITTNMPAGAAAPAIEAVQNANRDAQVYIRLNRKLRNPFLSHFQPGFFGSTSCEFLVSTMEGIGGGGDTTMGGRGGDVVVVEEQDQEILTGLYQFVRENVGEVTALLLTNGNSSKDKNTNSSGSGGSSGADGCVADGVSDAKPAAAASSASGTKSKSSTGDEDYDDDDEKMPASEVASPSPLPTTNMGVATRPSSLSARSVTNSPLRNEDDSADVEMADDPTVVPPSLASPPDDSDAATSRPDNSGDANNNDNNNDNGGIVIDTTTTTPAAAATAVINEEDNAQESPPPSQLTDWDVTLGRRRCDGTKPPTTATTCWINIVRGSRQHFPTAQNCLDGHAKLVFLATKGSGAGDDGEEGGRRDVRFYIALSKAYNNRHWVQDWTDRRTDGETVYVRANDVAVKYDIDSNDLRGKINQATATMSKKKEQSSSASSAKGGKSTKPPSVKETTATQRARAVKEGKYATCLIELAGKEKASTTLWSELAKAKQSYADNGGITDEEVDEYAGWVDVLARDYMDRASNMAMLTEVKKSLDATLLSAKSIAA